MDKKCTVYKTSEFIGKKWTLLILLELYKGVSKDRTKSSIRYSILKKRLPGITSKILSLRLRELENEDMIVKRIDASSFPIKCEYSLSDSGLDFINIIIKMKKWALKWKFENKVCEQSNCKDCPANCVK